MKSRSLTTTTVILYALAAFLPGLSVGEISVTVRAQTSDTVAEVNGTSITLKEVDNSVTSQLFPLKQQIYAIRKAALENLILRAILEHEAKGQGVSVEELRRKMTAGKVEVLPSQVEELYAVNASVFAAMSPDEAKERLRLDLESQARMRIYREALASLKKSSNTRVLLEEPTLPSVNSADVAPSIGSKEAPVNIVEFSDFQCRYCRESQGPIKEILKNYGSDVRVIFKHLPLDIHAEAFASAQAAFCAGEQGFFWQYHNALFASETLSPEELSRLASNLGLNLAKFKTCVLSEASRIAVRKDVQEARQLGINSTPTFIINGKLVRGAIGFEEFKTIIERELRSAEGRNHAQ